MVTAERHDQIEVRQPCNEWHQFPFIMISFTEYKYWFKLCFGATIDLFCNFWFPTCYNCWFKLLHIILCLHLGLAGKINDHHLVLLLGHLFPHSLHLLLLWACHLQIFCLQLRKKGMIRYIRYRSRYSKFKQITPAIMNSSLSESGRMISFAGLFCGHFFFPNFICMVILFLVEFISSTEVG